MTAAIQMIYQQLQQQATVLAMKDIYLITLAVAITGIFVVMFVIRTPRKKKVGLPSQNKNEEVVTAVAEEESLEPVFMH